MDIDQEVTRVLKTSASDRLCIFTDGQVLV